MLQEIQNEEEPFGLGCALETFSEFTEVLIMIEEVKQMNFLNQCVWEKPFEKYSFILGQYQEQPHLLDSKLDTLLDTLIAIVRDTTIDTPVKHLAFKYLFVIINTRGYKTIVQHLPHEVSDFEPVLQMLERQDPNDSDTWMTRYVLLLWLSIIVMIPFNMSRLDGFSPETSDTSKTVMNRVLRICKIYVVVPDKCRDAAAYLTGRFLTRYDAKEEHLKDFFDWTCDSSLEPDSNIFVQYGCLSAIAMILKLGKRDDLVLYARKLLLWIIDPHFKANPGTNIQKLCYKNIQRIGLTFLPACVAAWRYERGKRSLAANLSAGDMVAGCTSVKLSNACTSVCADTTHIEPSEETEIPDEVEEVIDQLIQGLRNSDSVVRWSAAKGIGRLTARLPKEFADEVVGSILELFSPREGDGAWHGGCLALAELGRRGLLLPQRLSEVVAVILKALVYDEPKGYSSVGSHIRDAACYVCWSFARAYEIDILKPFVNEIAGALLVVACFDREINCRRAASAAFQENVGRQGTFPHGIDILTAADFFGVSVRNNSYLNISVYIAQFEEYTLPLIKHLVDRKVSHWDIAIRELTAKALHNLTPQIPEYMSKSVLPVLFETCNSIDINVRHGSVLAIAEILFALSKINSIEKLNISDIIGNELVALTQNLVSDFYAKLYFRGIGGELMRQASCDFIEKCSLAHMPFHQSKVIDIWLNLMNECLSYDVVNVRMGAVRALPAFITEYYSQATLEQQTIIINNYINGLTMHSQISRMGNASALGIMPSFMLMNQLDRVLNSLVSATVISEDTLKWSESRRDAIKALTSICTAVENYIGTDVQEEHVKKICQTFLSGLTEYTQDNRGDIGAWVREASMVGLQTITMLLSKHKPTWLEPYVVNQIMAGVAQQAVEKIDRTRALAGKVFYSFIHSDCHIPNIPEHSQLKYIFSKEDCDTLNWNSAAMTFPKFVQLVNFPSYTYHILLGLVSSVGGLTETLVKCSSSSLFAYLTLQENEKGITEISKYCDIVYKIFCDFKQVDRIVVPLFKFLSRLLGSGCITKIITNPESDFSKRIFKLVQLEISGCKDIYKLMDGIDVLCQFIQIHSDVCISSLVQISILLCHRQSYVRRSTAGKLYEALLVYGDNSLIPQENLDDIMNTLSNTNWEDPVEVVKPIRNTLCNFMNIRVPVAKKKI